MSFYSVAEFAIASLISTALWFADHNPTYVTRLSPTDLHLKKTFVAGGTLMLLRIISFMAELGFRLYLYLKNPEATSNVLINTSSILMLTFSHSIGFVIGVSNVILKIKFDPIVIPLGIYLIFKALMVPIFVLFRSEGAVITLTVQLSKIVAIGQNWAKFCQSNQVAPEIVITEHDK